MDLILPAPPPVTLAIAGQSARFPVRRVYCVGRNYAEHAREMGHDPDREPPFFFLKPADALRGDGVFPYPPASGDVHHEVELAVLLGRGGCDLAPAAASNCVLAAAVALDMTRRDLQAMAKKAGRPWEAGKAFDHSAPIGPARLVADLPDLAQAGIRLAVNGETRQAARLADMIWSVSDIIAHLSGLFTLHPGDVILTGTPAGVGPVARGDRLEARIDGLPPLDVTVI